MLAVECQRRCIERRLETRYLDEATEDLDDALARIGKATKEGRALSVGLLGNAAEVFPELVRRGVRPDVVTDQTSAHDLVNGYLPAGWTVDAWRSAQADDSAHAGLREAAARWIRAGRPIEPLPEAWSDAGYVVAAAGVPVVPDALERVRRTERQGGKSAAGRRRNVAGAFAVPAGRRDRVAGRRVLLVDDVLTTGATAHACARALKAAGAAAVDLAVIGSGIDRERTVHGVPLDQPVNLERPASEPGGQRAAIAAVFDAGIAVDPEAGRHLPFRKLPRQGIAHQQPLSSQRQPLGAGQPLPEPGAVVEPVAPAQQQPACTGCTDPDQLAARQGHRLSSRSGGKRYQPVIIARSSLSGPASTTIAM